MDDFENVEFLDAASEVIETLHGVRPVWVIFTALASVAGGAAASYFITRRRLEAKYIKLADDEIAVMRQHYLTKAQAFEAEVGKGDLETIVKDRGYTPQVTEGPPLAVQPPTSVVETEETTEEAAEEPDNRPEVIKNIFREAKVTHEWDWHEERKRRSPDIPYVIHYDERHETEGYSDVSLTYYTGDDVLCNERDEVIDPDDRNELLGEGNLDRFGHGSGDAAIVFIRNDSLEILYEICKADASYAEEVHGFRHLDSYRGNLERMRARERDDYED